MSTITHLSNDTSEVQAGTVIKQMQTVMLNKGLDAPQTCVGKTSSLFSHLDGCSRKLDVTDDITKQGVHTIHVTEQDTQWQE